MGTVVAGVAGVVLGFLLPIGIVGMVGVATLGFATAAARLAFKYRGPREPAALPPTE